MPNNTIIFLGAGFSVGADIPIQSKIIDEMLKPPIGTQSSVLIEPENIKFLKAFVNVGLFLLKKFTNEDIKIIETNYDTLNYINQIRELLNSSVNEDKMRWLKTLLQYDEEHILFKLVGPPYEGDHIRQIINAEYYKQLVALKEKIRIALNQNKPNVDLEDLFTIFDKSLRENENWGDLTYLELDKLRHSLLRLFTYYFGKKLNKFCTSRTTKYNGFIDFCKTNKVGIITTNWDTVVEILFLKNEISFKANDLQYGIPNPIKLMKLHGSMNWFKCNCCGNYQIVKNSEIAQHLLDDNKSESCEKCKSKAIEDQVVLQPEIITPTMLKSFTDRLYKNIWSEAANEITNADKVIFVGYSLPLADFEIRYFLRKHIKKDVKIDVVLAECDKPLKKDIWFKPESRYKNLFPANSIQFYYEGFNSYFNQERT